MDPKILLIIGGLGLVGCLVLLFLGFSMLREERKAKEAAPAPKPDAEAPVPPAPASPDSPADAAGSLVGQTSTPAPGPGALASRMARLTAGVMARVPRGAVKGSAHEVLRVLRDNLTGRILIELAGQRYASPAEVNDADLRQALQTILNDLEAFQDGPASGSPASGSPASGGAEPISPAQPLPARVDLAQRVQPVLPASVPAPRAPGSEPRPLPRPTMNPFKQMAVLREIAKNPPPPTLTIAEQIDAVLQAHISGTPLVERGIHMRPGPRGDAIFELDGQSYTGVEELPEEAVRVVVRAAIAEWEAKQ